jgi:predicted dehydrogenase
MDRKKIAILGAGGRGQMFARLIADSPRGEVCAVAEPRQEYRDGTARDYKLPPGAVFKDWREFVALPRFCDAVVIATMDREHMEPAVACLKKGYDVLLEKPMATTLADCRAIEAAQRASGAIVGVCHSLRYQKGFRKVRDLLAAGAIGRVISLDLIEGVGWWHQAHSFVRGNWGNESRATFMLMAKSCHDIDYLCFLAGGQATKVSSFGSLSFFRPENAPAGSGDRCVACSIEKTCSYSAIKQYCEGDLTEWPTNVVSPVHTREAHLAAIATGPYGRCVWKCDNDVVDHQVVNLQFPNDITATFTMTAFTEAMGRRLRVFGTGGELEFGEKSIRIRTFADHNETVIQLGDETGGHGGGDSRIVNDWLHALHTRDASGIVANAQESLASHEVVFAAEMSRREGRTVSLDELRQKGSL